VQRQLRQDHASSVAVLVARLVDGSAQDRVEIDAQARLLGANPTLPYRCIAFTLTEAAEGSQESTTARAEWYAADPTPRLTRLQRHIVSALIEAKVPPAPIAGIRDQSLILLVPSAKRDSLEVIARALQPSRYRQVVVGGAGDVDETLFDARNSCQQAVAALEVGLRRHVGREVVRYGDVIVEVMLLGNRDASRRLIQDYLQPLADHPQLDETIRAFIESGQSTQATAERLIVHVNTIAYRLRRIRELTGRDIRSPSDAVNFSLALRARDLLRS
jgi:sugar diacid utilization regulator